MDYFHEQARDAKNKIKITIPNDDGSDGEIEIPSRWAICESCSGNGTTSRHVECDGGGFTGSEWAEQDDDFKEDYLAGRYDRACDECGGSGKVREVDTDRMDPALLARWEAHQEDEDEGACTNPAGHSFVCADVDNGGDGRTYCEWCLADGDA